MPQDLPELFGKYKIRREIGRGANAVVYEAFDITLDRTVVLKVLNQGIFADPVLVARFEREAKSAANLDHPHIVTIYEISEWQSARYIAMKYIPGENLKKMIQDNGPLPLERVAKIVGQIADALDYAHLHGLVHRDIKPSNILLGSQDAVTITDFGLAKATESSASLSSSGSLVGTPAYIAPELWEGKEANVPPDSYALGVVVYEMLTGQVPFNAETPAAVMRQHLVASIPPIVDSKPCLPANIQSVFERALAKNPEERFQSTRALFDALSSVIRAEEETLTERLHEEQAQEAARRAAEEAAAQAIAEQERATARQAAIEAEKRARAEERRKAIHRTIRETQSRVLSVVEQGVHTTASLLKGVKYLARRVSRQTWLAMGIVLVVVIPVTFLGVAALRSSSPSPIPATSVKSPEAITITTATVRTPIVENRFATSLPSPTPILAPHPTLPSSGVQSYFPLSVGNRWVYVGSSMPGDLTVQVTEKETISNTLTIPVEFSIPGSAWWKNNDIESSSNKSLAIYSYVPITLGNRPVDNPAVIFSSAVPILAFEPKSGDHWSASILVGETPGKATSEVLGFERITVRAGTFDAVLARYVIEIPQWRMQVVGWYAQEIGMVKMEIALGGFSFPMELKEYSVKLSRP